MEGDKTDCASLVKGVTNRFSERKKAKQISKSDIFRYCGWQHHCKRILHLPYKKEGVANKLVPKDSCEEKLVSFGDIL